MTMTNRLGRATYVICEGQFAGLTLYRIGEGWIVAMLRGGFACYKETSLRAAGFDEQMTIERAWQDADKSRNRVDHDALERMAASVQEILTGI